MSQYTAKHPTKTGKTLTYGYDRQLQHYFYTVSKNGKPVEDDGFAGCNAGTLLEKADKHGFSLPDEHVAALALDLPF